jgi:hypothetical protein
VLFNATVAYSASQLVSNLESGLNLAASAIEVVGTWHLNNSSATGPLDAVALTNPNCSSCCHMTEAEESLIVGSPMLLDALQIQSITNNNTAGIRDTMQFRLVGGATATSGLLQMRPFPEADWGTVCSTQSIIGTVDPNVLTAMCRSAGVANPTPAIAQPNYTASGYIWASSVRCPAGATMADCNFLYSPPSQPGTTGCSHDYDMWLDCFAELTPPRRTAFVVMENSNPAAINHVRASCV